MTAIRTHKQDDGRFAVRSTLRRTGTVGVCRTGVTRAQIDAAMKGCEYPLGCHGAVAARRAAIRQRLARSGLL